MLNYVCERPDSSPSSKFSVTHIAPLQSEPVVKYIVHALATIDPQAV